MKNKRLLYHILMLYEIVCSGALVFLCIRMNRIVDFSFITALTVIKQVSEILIYFFFFYMTYKNKALIMPMMDLAICMQFFFLGADFATGSFGISRSPLFVQILKVAYIIYLIFCRNVRIKELDQKTDVQ